ncbi:MAG: hypothetical protein JNL44_13750 [Gemmatimonadetes bacterium]|nr:hypothetical protein [Gemmatimonadota bacterium]
MELDPVLRHPALSVVGVPEGDADHVDLRSDADPVDHAPRLGVVRCETRAECAEGIRDLGDHHQAGVRGIAEDEVQVAVVLRGPGLEEHCAYAEGPAFERQACAPRAGFLGAR